MLRKDFNFMNSIVSLVEVHVRVQPGVELTSCRLPLQSNLLPTQSAAVWQCIVQERAAGCVV